MFKLYTKDSPTLRFREYGSLLSAATGAKSVLEFGPGFSTLALIEAGVENIVSLEHSLEWMEKKRAEFAQYPQVTVAQYWDEFPVRADEIANQQFDLAFVDSPQGFNFHKDRVGRKKHPGYEDCSRLNTCLFALDHAPVVYLHDANRPLERATLTKLSGMGHKVQFVTYGGTAALARIEAWQRREPI